MNISSEQWTVDKLAAALKDDKLRRRDEYQRGETWTTIQKQRFIDSVYRGYPVPAIFIHVVRERDLIIQSEQSIFLYIVDGQQRLSAIRDYVHHGLKIPPLGGNSKLRLPEAIANTPAPWTDRKFCQVEKELHCDFLNREIPVYLIETKIDEEVRDLFIRLQSGKALSRQQIRDAWPGNLAPFVESLGGKFASHPHVLFTLIDKRSERQSRDESDGKRDPYTGSRQLCAQLLHLWFERQNRPDQFPNTNSAELDELYHVRASFPSAMDRDRQEKFVELLDVAAQVVRNAMGSSTKRQTVTKLEVFSLFTFLSDHFRPASPKWNSSSLRRLSLHVSQYKSRQLPGARTKATTLTAYFTQWVDELPSELKALMI